MSARTDSIRAHAKRIVERDCHVSATVRKALYHVITRLHGGRAFYRSMPREERLALWHGAADGVQSNRGLYFFVMRGGAR